MATIVGKVTVWGLDGELTYTGVGATAIAADNVQLESVTFDDGVDELERRDKSGEVIGLWLYNKRKGLNITFYPAAPAGAGAIAIAKEKVALPTAGSKIHWEEPVGGSGVKEIESPDPAAALSPDWLYAGGGAIEFTNTGEVKMTLPVRQYSTDIAYTANT